MAQRGLVLTDTESGLWLDETEAVFNAETAGIHLPTEADWSLSKRTLFGGVSDGIEVVDLDNGALSLSILTTRGMGLWRGEYNGIPIGWQSPVKWPVHPSHVNLHSRNGLGWLDGFNELLCRCGLAGNGPPGIDEGAASPIESQLTLHGRIANLPAHRVEIQADDAGEGRLSVMGIVDECTMFGPQLRLSTTISTAPGANWVTVVDEVTNMSSQPTELQLLYHVNIGESFLEEGSRILTPASSVTPRDARAAEGIDTHSTCLGPTAGYAEQVYFYEPLADGDGLTTALLHNRPGDLGLSVDFRPDQLPCFSAWKNTIPREDGYVAGLEPGTNFPNLKSFEREQGRVVSLASGETRRMQLTLRVHDSAGAVEDVVERIEELQSAHPLEERTSPELSCSPAP